MQPIIWSTKKVKLSELKLYEDNPRILSRKDKKDLQASLSKFNLVEIPAVNLDMTIIAGNQRITLLREKHGIEYEIEVRVPDRQLSSEECKEYLLRSNKNTAKWDIQKLLRNFERDTLHSVGFTAKDLLQKVKDTEDEFEFKIPQMEMTSFESYDYILLMFNNTPDYVQACEKFGIEEKVAINLNNGVRKTGFGRAVDGNEALKRIEH